MTAAPKSDIVSSEHMSSLKVFDETGEPVILSKLWQTQPAVLYFVRHFG